MSLKKLSDLIKSDRPLWRGAASLFGGGRRQPVNEDDSGRSTARLYVVYALSVGVIQGLVDGAKSIYLDRQAVERPGGVRNFPGFKYIFRRGSPTQNPLFGFASEVGTEVAVGVTVTKNGGSVTRSFTNPETDLIKIRLAIQMQEQTKKGVVGGTIRFKVFTKEGAAGFVQRDDRTIKGKYSELTEFQYSHKVNNQGGTIQSYQVRVERVTDDPPGGNNNIQSILRWEAYTPLTTDKFSYPNTAIVAMAIRGEQFNSAPEVSFKLNGYCFPVPSNAVVDADGGLTFTGNWNGTFTYPLEATTDPAWVYYTFRTNKDFGAGAYITDPSKINIYDLYACSVYNNQMVPDGRGGQERRYAISTAIEESTDARVIIEAILSAMHSREYDSYDQVRIWQDRPTAPSKLFTQADVFKITYGSTSPVRSRPTAVDANWNNPNNFFESETEPYEDKVRIQRFGYRKESLELFGCTSRSRASRMARWYLWTAWNQVKTISMTSRPIAVGLLPGDVIEVADPKRSLVRFQGLIASATASTVTVDSAVTIVAGSSPQLIVTLPNGVTETRAIANGAGNHTVLSVSPAFSQAPQPESNWAIKTNQVVPTQWRILNVMPDPQDVTKVEIFGFNHDPNKYAEIELGIDLPDLPTRFKLPDTVTVPSFAAARYYFEDRGVVQGVNLIVIWNAAKLNGESDPAIAAYAVEYSLDGLEWMGHTVRTVGNYVAEFDLPYDESVYARVASIDLSGRYSDWVQTGVAILTGNYHPDTIAFDTRRQSAGLTVTSAQLDAIDVFVKECYRLGLRDEADVSKSIVQEFSPFVGTQSNDLKLWSVSGAFNGAVSASVASMSDSRGLTWLSATPLNINTKVGRYIANNVHMGMYLTHEFYPNVKMGIVPSPANEVFIRDLGFYCLSSGLRMTSYGNYYPSGVIRSNTVNVLNNKPVGFFLGNRQSKNYGRITLNTVEITSTDKGEDLSSITAGYANRDIQLIPTAETFSGQPRYPSIGCYSLGLGMSIQQGEDYTKIVNDLMRRLGRIESNVLVYANTDYNVNPVAGTYKQRLEAIGVMLSTNHLEAISRFCNGIAGYLPNGFDCCPFAGSVLNGVKLYNNNAAPQNISYSGFTTADWSEAYGLDPNGATGKSGNLGFSPQAISGTNNLHMCVYSTKDIASSGAADIWSPGSGAASASMFLKVNTLNPIADLWDGNTGRAQAASPSNTIAVWMLSKIQTEANHNLLRLDNPNLTFTNTAFQATAGSKSNVTGNFSIVNGSVRSMGFYSVGGAIPAANIQDYMARVKELMIDLGRV